MPQDFLIRYIDNQIEASRPSRVTLTGSNKSFFLVIVILISK